MGYIKKLKNNELVGGTDKTTIYPVTSTKAVFEEVTDGDKSSFKSQETINGEHDGRIKGLENEMPDTVKSITINGGTKTYLPENGNVELTIYSEGSEDYPGIAEAVQNNADNITAIQNEIGTDTTEDTLSGRIKSLENAVGTGGSVDQKISNGITTALDSLDAEYSDDGESYIDFHLKQADGKIDDFEIEDSKLQNAITSLTNAIGGGNITLVESLPTAGDAGKIYRVVNNNNTYTDYMYVAGESTPWKLLAVHDLSTIQPQIAYYTCTASGSGALETKVFVSNGSLTYSTANGGHIKIKMGEANTHAAPVYLKFNTEDSTSKQVYYNGDPVSASNTWEKDEVISVYYDGTYYQASNAQGGGDKAEKVKYDNSQSRLNATNVQGAVDEVSGELTIAQNKTIDSTQASGWLNLPSVATAYVVPSNDMVTRYIPVVAGNTYQVSGNYSGSNVYARIGFATNVPAGGVAATVIYDILITGGFTRTYKPTADGYLSISHYNQSGMTPAVFKLIETPLKGTVIDLSDEVDDLHNQINNTAINHTTINNLNRASGASAYAYQNGYQTRYIPIKSGNTYLATFNVTTSGTDVYARFATSENIPDNNVASTFRAELNAANTTVSITYTAENDGYLSVSYAYFSNNTYTSTFTQLAGNPELGTSKAELIPVGGAMITINTVYPADNTPRVIIPRTSYIIYKDKVLHLSDVYSQDITLSLTGLSGVLRVSFDSIARNFSVKSLSDSFGKTEMEVFTIDLTSGDVTLPDNFYRFNGVIGAGKEKRLYLADNKLELTGKTLHGYDAINFGYPVLTGASYVDGGGTGHALGDIAIYGDEMFAFYQNGYVNVYNISDINNVTLSGSFRLQTDIHCNAAQFATTVLEGETYPLIYVANGIQDGGGDFTTVEQIRKENGVYTSTLVQIITVTNTPDYKINTIIGDDGYFWAIGNKGATNNIFYYAKFSLPDISNPTVTLNYNSNSIEKWTESKSYSTAPYVQGCCVHQGKVFHVLGNGDGVSETLNEIHVVDLNTRTPLTDFVLTDFDYTKIQGCDVYKGSLIVSRNFGKGFTMLIFD